MLIPGLVSISFRKLTPKEILDLCVRTGLKVVEWGGDVHVPPDDAAGAARVRAMSTDSGIGICSYGSYFRLGQPMELFRQNLEAALNLGTRMMRIWAGTASAPLTEAQRAAYVDQLLRCTQEASEVGVRLTLEYHPGTLLDDRDSARRLMRETESVRGQLFMSWQPRWDWAMEERLGSFADVQERLGSIHVFTWRQDDQGLSRMPLAAGEGLWRDIFGRVRGDHDALMEFVENDDPEALVRDARVFLQWLDRANA